MQPVLQRCMCYLSRDTAAWRHSLPLIWSTSCVHAFTHRHWKDACTNNRDNRTITLFDFSGIYKRFFLFVRAIVTGVRLAFNQNWLWQSREKSFNLYYVEVSVTADSVMVPQSSANGSCSDFFFFRDKKLSSREKERTSGTSVIPNMRLIVVIKEEIWRILMIAVLCWVIHIKVFFFLLL